MADGITFLDWQPISFNITGASDTCTPSDYTYNFPIERTDNTYIQAQIQPCSDEVNLVQNGDFGSITGTQADDWSTPVTSGTAEAYWLNVQGGVLIVTNQDTGSATFSTVSFNTSNQVVQEGYYKGTINIGGVDSESAGTNTLTISTTTVGTVFTSLFENLVIGENTFYFWHDGTVPEELNFSIIMSDTNFVAGVSVTSVEVKRMPLETAFGVVNTDTDTVEQLFKIEDYLSYTTQTSDEITLIDQWLTINIDWSTLGLSNGCYKVCFYDPCLNTNSQLRINNPHLAQLQGEWTFGLGAGFNSYHQLLFNVGGGGTATATNTATLQSGLTYNVDFVLGTVTANSSITAVSGANTSSINITAGDSNSTVSTTITGDDAVFKITGSAVGTFAIFLKSVRVYLSDADLTCNKESDQMKLGTWECSTLVRMCHDENAHGFKFTGGTNFTLVARLPKTLLTNVKYRYKDRIVNTNSNLYHRNVYGERFRQIDFRADLIPEYVLDFLSLIPVIDHIYLDGEEYIVPEDEEPQIRMSENAKGFYNYVVTLEEKSQVISRNRATTTEGVGCVDGAVLCLLDPQTDLCVIDPSTGEIVLSYE